MRSAELSPVLLFVYRRPAHTRRTLEALRRNELARETELVVFSDGAVGEEDGRGVSEVRALLEEVEGFRRVRRVYREEHLGLAESVISGVTEELAEAGRVIVLEDDLVTSPWFLRYMNRALSTYGAREDVMSVSGCSLPLGRVPRDYGASVWLSRRHLSHGWGTWADAWGKVDWEVRDFGRFREDAEAQERFDAGGADLSRALIRQQEEGRDLWAVRFSYAHFRHEALSVVPIHGYVRHIGYDGSGENCLWNPLRWGDSVRRAPADPVLPADLAVDERLQAACRRVIWRRERWGRVAEWILGKGP